MFLFGTRKTLTFSSRCVYSGETKVHTIWFSFKWDNLQTLEKCDLFNFTFNRPYAEGILELTLRNTTSEWVSISKAIFNAYGMKLYYEDSVFMKAHMDILSKNTAETSFDDHRNRGGLKIFHQKNLNTGKEAIEVYNRKLVIVPLKFEMRVGF